MELVTLQDFLMLTSYYLACFESNSFVWIGAMGDRGQRCPPASPISLFCLVHRNRALMVVSEEHPILAEGTEWDESSAPALYLMLTNHQSPGSP